MALHRDVGPVDAGLVAKDGNLLMLAGVPRAERPEVEAAAAGAMRQLTRGSEERVLSAGCVSLLMRISNVEQAYVIQLDGTPEQNEAAALVRELADFGYVSLVEASLEEQAPGITPFIGARVTNRGGVLLQELAKGQSVSDAQAIAGTVVRPQSESTIVTVPHHASGPTS